MSWPTQSTRSEGSFHGSSQHAAVEDIQDTTMSMADAHVAPGSVSVETTASASSEYMIPVRCRVFTDCTSPRSTLVVENALKGTCTRQ